MEAAKELTAEALYQEATFDDLDFQTTTDLEVLPSVIGQPRAVEAVQFSIGIAEEGYNVFVLGPTGVGRHALVKQSFCDKAATEAPPADWVYVNNFEETYKPHALRLPPGRGRTLQHDMEQLVDEIQTALSTAFESEEYQARRQEAQQEFQEQQESGFENLQERAREKNLALLRTPSGLVFAPVRDGEVLAAQEVQALSEDVRKTMEADIEKLQEDLQKILQQMPRLQRQMQERIRELNREIASFAVGGLIEDLRTKYNELEEIVHYLATVQQDVIENVQNFFAQEGEGQAGPQNGQSPATRGGRNENPLLRRYRVNVLVDHSDADGAPVIYEDNPTQQNLVGRTEYVAQMGALLTDFNLIKPGALHRANGGYLILDAVKVLQQPFAWESLKRALRAQQLRIESPGQMYNLISTVSLEPEPIPLQVKVALIGDAVLYYLLSAHDPEFAELFKVAADFAEQMDRTPASQQQYARLIAQLVRDHDLPAFDRSAVARIIEHSARLVGDAHKLTTQVSTVSDLLREASYWANNGNGNGASEQKRTVTAADVQQAIDARIFRADRLRERVQESMVRETILIDTEGETVGQINGLSVIQLGSFAFGRPSRITARIRMGSGDVVDIERKVDLSGPLHAKGVLILTGFLGERYGTEQPLSLSASLVFEQSYGGVDGDSASSAELYALLSAIAQVPIKQSLAVTGSVNQRGQVQAIGGANEKIEGFFDLCQTRGLTGKQGVLIPAANVKHLMLRQDVVDAVAAGQFHIYAVETIDQGIELLTGRPAGERDEEGTYPEGSINALVEARLASLAEKRSSFNAPAPQDTAKDEAA
ncbi:MAG TPA: ATP-binding protein [Caldilineaceae bacterium]|nr:ATP-binding protein [Caldilineaceae bacterium]